MESEKKQELVIDGNSFYEIDLKCLEEKKQKQEEAKKRQQKRGCRTNVRQLILYSTQNAGLRKARRLWYN